MESFGSFFCSFLNLSQLFLDLVFWSIPPVIDTRQLASPSHDEWPRCAICRNTRTAQAHGHVSRRRTKSGKIVAAARRPKDVASKKEKSQETDESDAKRMGRMETDGMKEETRGGKSKKQKETNETLNKQITASRARHIDK